MQKMLKVVALVLVMILSLTISVPAFAASKSSRVSGTKTYTITTHKNKDCTLTVSQSAGKVYASKWKNVLKRTTKTVTTSMRGEYYISVTRNGRQVASATINYPFNSKVKFNLTKNSTYKVTITYKGFSDEILNGAFNPTRWKTYPSVKVDVNKSAKIK